MVSSVEQDIRFGRSLRAGPGGIVFKVSPVPDFRFLEQDGLSAQNRYRYGLYLERLSASGGDPVVMRARVQRGVRRLYAVTR